MALFGKQKTVGQVLLLDIASVSPNPYQPRRRFEPEALEELAESIRQNGLLQPITVRRIGEGYELIAGERRLMACKRLGMDKMPAILEECGDEQSAVFALIENLQRQDLNYFEQAQGMQKLMKSCGLTQEQLAKQLGKSQPTIANKLRLLTFPEPLQRKILENGLTERHARALLKLPPREWEDALQCVIDQKFNVGDTEKYVAERTAKMQSVPLPKKPTRLLVLRDFRIFMNTISQAVNTMKLAGIEIATCQEEDEEFIHYTLRIPKKSAYRSHSA